ncbi:MAG: sensor histidine kinase [Thermodesulfobacteriota bacterium]
MAKNLIPPRHWLEDIVSTIQRIFENVREISTNLRPPVLDHQGILVTIHWFCRQFQRIHSGIRLDKQLHMKEADVPESLKIVIYRVLQEALNRLVKHAKPDHIRISLKEADDTIYLSIEGDGQGFDIDEILSEENSAWGGGFVSMIERVKLSGGVFSAESKKGTGAVIRASWPCQKKPPFEQ